MKAEALIEYFERDLDTQSEFKSLSQALRSRLFPEIRDLMEQPYELKSYRGCKVLPDNWLQVSLKYKNRPQFSGIFVELKPTYNQDNVRDIAFRMRFTIKDPQVLTHTI